MTAANRANRANFLKADAEDVFREVEAKHAQTPEKRPLFRELPPAPVFPVEALGPLRAPAVAIQSRTQAPVSMCAQAVLAVATLAIQAHVDVELPGGGIKPVVGFFGSIGESGDRKTTVDKIASAAVRRVEAEWGKDYKLQQAEYVNRLTAWRAVRGAIKKAPMGEMIAAYNASGPEPEPPPHPMLICADVTPEALVLHLEQGRSSAGVFTAEGGILVGGAAFNDESRMRTAALFNQLWDAEPIRRSRVGTKTTFLPGRRCSGHIMMQPVVANKLLGDAMLESIGFVARMLIVAPDSTAGTRLFKPDDPQSSGILQAFDERITALLKLEPNTVAPDSRELEPRVLTLSTEAREAWIVFHDHCEIAIRRDGKLATIKAFAAKLAEHAGRLAAVLTVYDDLNASMVPGWAMECGKALAGHYAMEMLRLHGGASISPHLREAQKLLEWWQRQDGPILHLAKFYQRGPASLRDKKEAMAAVSILIDHGWAERLEPGTEVDGAPRKHAFQLIL